MKRLQRMLDTAVKKRQRIDDLKSEGPAGAPKLQEEQWADALESASGTKTILDASKLRKAIKKREKKKQVSAQQWKVRTSVWSGLGWSGLTVLYKRTWRVVLCDIFLSGG